MIRDSAVAEVLVGLGNRSGAVLETTIRNQFLTIQQELEQEPELPWFLRTEISSSVTTPGDERVPKPHNFLAEWEDDALWFYDTDPEPGYPNWRDLRKGELDGLRQEAYAVFITEGEDPANPQAIVKPQTYAFDGFYFRIQPVPDKVYQLRMIYYAEDQTLETNIENKWLKYSPDIFIGIAGQRVGAALGLDEARKLEFANREARGRKRNLDKTTELALTNRPIMMGGADN